MANAINITFSGSVNLKSAKYLYTNNGNPDCWNAIFNNFENSAYTFNSNEISPIGGSWSEDNSINRNNTGFSPLNVNLRLGWLCVNYRFKPTTIVIETTTSSTSITLNISNFSLWMGNSTSGYEVPLHNFYNKIQPSPTIIPNATQPPAYIVFNNIQEYITQEINEIEIQVTGTSIRIFNLYVYGEIFHKDLITLPPTQPATTIEEFTDSTVGIDADIEGVLYKRNLMSLQPNKGHSVTTITLTGAYDISEYEPYSVILLNPNGANRIVRLPENPPLNYQTRLINLNGNFEIEIEELPGNSTVQLLSTAEGQLVLDVFWDGTQWITTAL
jgi:hypothetical protein